ncbi:MAG TPA: hypothetical protein VGR47_14660 [Terracidiphilus sp.]|nr:hypothetical protein [Terracidiphilus sp.]
MKAIGRILIALLFIGLLILLGYVAYVYVLPRWCALLFYTYLLLGLLLWTYGIITFISANRHTNWAAGLFKEIVKARQPLDIGSRVNRLRDVIAGLALAASNLIVWPVDAVYGPMVNLRNKGKELTPQDYSLLQATEQPDTYKSLYSLVVVLTILGLTYVGVNLKIYGPIVLGLMVASASLRHVSYVVGTVSLPARLRRAAASAYALFLAIAVFDFATLILGLTTLDLRGKAGSLTLSALVKTGRELWQAEGALWNILKGTRPTLHQLIVAFVGLLFSIALVKVATEFREFRRNDEDYVWLAKSANALGNFSDALRYLRNVQSSNTDSRSTEIVALLGVNQIDEAATKLKYSLEQDRKPATDELIFTNMMQAFLLPRMPQNVYLAVLKRAIDAKMADALMQDSLGLVSQYKLQQQALALFTAASASFPLSIARIHLISDELKETITTLETNPPASDLDKLIGQILVLMAHIMDEQTSSEQDAETFASFARETIPLIQKLVNAPLNQWQRITLYQEIQRALFWARKLGQDRVEELRFLANSVADQQKEDDFKQAIQVIQAQFA